MTGYNKMFSMVAKEFGLGLKVFMITGHQKAETKL